MKRVVLSLSILLFGIVLVACGDKSKDAMVQGILIGGPIEDVKDLGSYEKNDKCEIITHYKNPTEGKIRFITIYEMKGKVQGISLGIKPEFVDDYIEEMTRLYGEPEVSMGSIIKRGFRYNEKGILYEIFANEYDELKGLEVTYASRLLYLNVGRVQVACHGK